MRTLIKELSKQRFKNPKCIKIHYSFVGSSYDLKLDGDFKFESLIERSEILRLLKLEGHITKIDPETNLVKRDFKWVEAESVFYDYAQNECFIFSLFGRHLLSALEILDYRNDPEDLWQYFNDYTIIERCALVWLLSQKDHIELPKARLAVTHIFNHMDGITDIFDQRLDWQVCLFARWLKMHPLNLLALAPRKEVATSYTATATY